MRGQPCVPALARRCTTRQGPPPRVEGSPRLTAVCTPAPAPAIPGVTCTCLRSRAAAADVGGVVVLCVAAGGLGSLPRGSWPSPFCFPTLHPPFGHASPATACVCAVCSPALLVLALSFGRGAAMCSVDRPRAQLLLDRPRACVPVAHLTVGGSLDRLCLSGDPVSIPKSSSQLLCSGVVCGSRGTLVTRPTHDCYVV